MDILNIIVDLIMVGYISSAAIAAVGVSMQFIMLNFSFVTVFYVGTNALVSRFIGAGDKKSANQVTFNMLLFGLSVGLPLMFTDFAINSYYFEWLNLGETSASLGEGYLGIILMTIPFLFIRVVIVGSFSAAGDTKTPMKVKIFTFFLNILFNYLLIFGKFGFPELGVKGAAWATFIASLMEIFIYLVMYFSRRFTVYYEKKFDFDFIRRAVRVGFPTGVERFFTFVSFVLMSKFIALYGTDILAGSQIALRIEGLAFMPGVGFMIASMALIGQAIGAENHEEGRREIYYTATIASLIMGLIGIAMVIFSRELASVFTADKETVAAASLYLRIVGLSQVPLAGVFVFDGALRGAGATKITFVVNLVGLWLFRIVPIYYLSHHGYSVGAIFWVVCLETYLRAFVFWVLFKKGVWIGVKV